MAGGGGEIVPAPVSPCARQPCRGGGRRSRHKAAVANLPLDIIAEIAARSDATTLVRCAATCRGARRHIAEDPNLRARLRLRDTGRFLRPLMRGHLTGFTIYKCGTGRSKTKTNKTTDVYLVDITGAADTTRVVEVAFVSAAAEEAETSLDMSPIDSRGGLVRATATAGPPWDDHRLFVCNPATGRRLLALLPPEPTFPEVVDDYNPKRDLLYASRVVDDRDYGGEYVLLVGDRDDGGEGGTGTVVGRPFQVLKAKLALSKSKRWLMFHTFSSEHGAWSPLIEIPTPNIRGSYLHWEYLPKPLVVGDVVHWLCQTDVRCYVLMLDVTAARVNETALPASFPHFHRRCLLATASASGNPIVLFTRGGKVLAWEQSKHTKTWKSQPQVVIENKTILRLKNGGLAKERTTCVPQLLLFGERSGVVLLRIQGYHLLWLDLHSKKIIRCFSSDRWMSHYAKVYCPYEVDPSSWVPTFSSSIVSTI